MLLLPEENKKKNGVEPSQVPANPVILTNMQNPGPQKEPTEKDFEQSCG